MRVSPQNAPPSGLDIFRFAVSRSLVVIGASAALVALATCSTHAQSASGEYPDYSSILSNACDGCTASCESLATAGSDWGGSAASRSLGLVRDFVFGRPCDCGGSGGGCLDCAGTGSGGNFWNDLCSGQSDGASQRMRGLTSMLASGVCGRGGCRNDCEPGAGYVGWREPPIYCGMPAPTYPVPFAVPQHVGYTQFTYPPFMPHHSLPHYRHTYSYRHAPGMSRTTVHWRSTVARDVLAKLHHMIKLPR